MQQVRYKNPSFSFLQRLFVELCLEACDSKSLDSYRAKVAGPLSIMHELYRLLDDWNKKKIKSFETVAACRDETIDIVEQDQALLYGRSSSKSLVDLLKTLHEKNNDQDLAIKKAEYLIYYLTTINEDYAKKCLDKIYELITTDPAGEDIVKGTKSQTGFLISELINKGYSKGYLKKLIESIFVHLPASDFDTCWASFRERVNETSDKSYTVIFKAYIQESSLKGTNIIELYDHFEESEHAFITKLKKPARNFLKPNDGFRFIKKEIHALDYLQGFKKAKTEVANLLDLLHLGYCNLNFQIRDTALVIDNENPEGARLQSIHDQVDDSFASGDDLYSMLYSKLNLIKSYEYIAPEVKAKIDSAIRYLRAGSEIVDFEQKFLNYWIGLENIFSNHNVKDNTFLRIKIHFTNTHAASYAKRNLLDLHKSIKALSFEKITPGYKDDLIYLCDANTYIFLESLHDKSAIIATRAKDFRLNYLDAKCCEESLTRHRRNLERHLARMYRIRNELVHNAAIMQNIEGITSNLRYYLLFVLYKSIEYFCQCQPKSMDHKLVDMDDFFQYQELIWNDFKINKFNIGTLARVPNSVEFMS